ncbi:efflux RND transporter periplasmic adaptor subunit [Desulforamulus aeronauticus]|uniref:efflux RND transporter periplasmic adaptor subunit n=1 Tax=Desulforamulus aeronauticus TaxID=53343 RepID=UPI000A068909|nr:efflux RND transporter periplasmic adaptor subunit [Desulforamulus aeronauticus]
MKKYGIFLATGLLILILSMLLGCAKETKQNQQQAKGNQPGTGVKIVKVSEGTLKESMTLSGTLQALNSANIVAKSSGKVASIEADVGSRISAGQILMSLEADDLAAAVSAAEANVETAKVTYDLALKKYERGKELMQSQAIAQADFEENYEGSLRKAQAAVKASQSALAQSQVRYNDTVIKSPLGGIVTARNIEVGELAGTSTPLFTVSNLDQVVVIVNVNEQQVNKLAEGMKVGVRVTAANQNQLTGVVSNIALAADAKLKVFPIKVQLANPDHQLKPGMFAEVLLEKELESSLLIPREAVLTIDGKSRVFVVEDGVARERLVETGPTDGRNISILKGLAKDEEIITNNVSSMKDGQRVNIQTEGTMAKEQRRSQ